MLDTPKRQAPIRGYIIKNSTSRSIAPELIAMEQAYPGILQHWMEHGIDIIVSANGIAVFRFNGWSATMEIGARAAEIIAPNAVRAEGPQQAVYLGIPLFMHGRDECYDVLELTLCCMFTEGHLTDVVNVSHGG
jgi:hypothetical protein